MQVLVIHLSNLVWIGAKKAGAGAAESRCKLSGKRREKNANQKQKSKQKARLKKSLIDGFVQVRLLSVFSKKTKKFQIFQELTQVSL